MRGSGAVGRVWRTVLSSVVLLVVAVVALTVLGGGRDHAAAPARGARPAAAATGHGAVFLAAGECSSFGTTRFTEVPCAGERAAARVVARYDGSPGRGPRCPPTTDFVLRVGLPGSPAAIPEGYACMRGLEPPHPGDPGAGGGPRTIPGDCLYDLAPGRVRETPCDGSGPHEPRYRLLKAVRKRTGCPASTALYVALGGAEPVGCARRIRPAGPSDGRP
ncbi:hypothetical protein [Streptomyces sp. NPDC005573]|uniref:hypothetical protein n=1 Tax=Streptomyces sp. NPDC005573 TaxID=3156890 RepID=UPI0033B31F6E